MMNRTKRLFALIMVLGLFVAPAAYGQDTFVKFGTASSGGLFNALGVAICQVWNEKIPGNQFTAQVTGGSSANSLGIGQEKYDFALATGNIASDAFKGKGKFEGKQVQNLRAIANLYPAVMQIIVLNKSGIESLETMKGKTVNIGQAGSGSAATASSFLAAFNLKEDQDYKASRLNHGNAADAVIDEKIDGYINFGTVGQSWHMQAFSTGKVHMVPIPKDASLEAFLKEYDYYYPFTIKANAYPNQEKPIPTVASSTLLIVREGLDENIVYEATKQLFENQKGLAELNNVLADMTPESAIEGITVPLHPGAEKYYREIGVIK